MKQYLDLKIKVVYIQEDVLTQSGDVEFEKEKDVSWGELFD